MLPVFTVGFNLIFKSPVPFAFSALVFLPLLSIASLTCGLTSLITGSGGGAVGAGGSGGGGAGGKGGGGAAVRLPPITQIRFRPLLVL